MSTLLLAASLSLLIGAVLGLLGGGGGILAVPLLVYVLGVAPKPAIAASLFFVGATSVVGAAMQARAGRVRYKLGGLFGAASMLAAFVAGRLAQLVPEKVLLVGLAVVMLATALAMLRGRAARDAQARPLAAGRVLAIGAGVGAVSGLVGAGGGFLIVPALTLFGGLAMHEAIATSLLIIALQSFAGFAGHLAHTALDWQLIATMTGAAIVGLLLGAALGKRVSAQSLKRAFAALVLVTGLFVLGRQLPALWTLAVALGASLIALASLVAGRKATRLHRLSSTEKECTTSARFQP